MKEWRIFTMINRRGKVTIQLNIDTPNQPPMDNNDDGDDDGDDDG
jgi:hypothetical protein